ncbi:hypothetical protein [Azoarcus sp. KH32C]|uniref:hypothetical protein n=1 Tax=Azoarcus sp. KH32C TaxID=748247 RepID=UPI0002385D10|nr:hypothetical protein [Azoarcus sp. KH32C]BAL27515.1 hypothetical protein AZKH_p0632 [Azoarcus sp. KH32C]
MDKRINSVGTRPARQAVAGLGALTQGAVAAIGDVPVGIHARAIVPSIPATTQEADARDGGLLVQRCRT